MKNKHMSKIRTTLNRIGAISDSNVELFSENARDKKINVYRDALTNVIFIDNYYVGNSEYEKGQYRNEKIACGVDIKSFDYEDLSDVERRINSYKKFITDKSLCDFGCGAGSFLKAAKSLAKKVVGIELQKSYQSGLNVSGINCKASLEECDMIFDVVTMFHSFEHLPDPIETLKNIKRKLSYQNGIVIIEVPHARDFLMEHLKLQEFIDFTLWSQHLILHTRDSLRLMLKAAGFQNIIVEGVQRYSISNHLNWLLNKSPGGHRGVLAAIETQDLKHAYECSLSKIDATDTLVAIATI